MEVKTCANDRGCGISKPVSEFYETSRGGYFKHCKECMIRIRKENAIANGSLTQEQRVEKLKRNTEKLAPQYKGVIPIGVYLKRCTICKVIRPHTDYHIDNSRTDGLRPTCEYCVKGYTESRSLNKISVIEKACRTCTRVLPYKDFHRSARAPDGLNHNCKDCTAIEAKGRSEKDGIEEYLRRQTTKCAVLLGLTEIPMHDLKLCVGCDKVKDVKKFSKSSRGRDGLHAYCKACNSMDNPKSIAAFRYRARLLLREAVRKEVVTPPKCCERCDKERTLQGHHNDYSNPLEVEWLCSECHRTWHKEHKFIAVLVDGDSLLDYDTYEKAFERHYGSLEYVSVHALERNDGDVFLVAVVKNTDKL